MTGLKKIPQKRFKNLPWYFSLIISVGWGLLFIIFGNLHGMWEMFENTYPSFSIRLFSLALGELSPLESLLLIMLDGAIAGWLLGWLFRYLLRRTI